MIRPESPVLQSSPDRVSVRKTHIERRDMVVELYRQGLGTSRIHKRTGISKSRISAYLHSAGVAVEQHARHAAHNSVVSQNAAMKRNVRAIGSAFERPLCIVRNPLRASWYQRNRDKHLANCKAYYAANKQRINANPLLRIRKNLRLRVHKLLHGCVGKSALVGCTNAQLRVHLESQFIAGMTWQNYGTAWHVDHIIPLAAFDLSQAEQRTKACHYTNLQPLWARDNMRKGASLTWVGRK
jgi:hypothetical protein